MVANGSDNGPRVMAVIPGDGGGSSFIFARRQVDSLLEVGVNVRSFFLPSRTSPTAILKDWRRLRHEIREFRPHLVHAHYGTVTSFLCAVATITPLVITFRGNDLDDDPDISFFRTRLGHVLSQISCLRAQRIICVSRHLRDLLWWRRDRAVVIPTGVDLHLFRPQPKDQARALLGWEQAARIVVFNEAGCPRVKGSKFVDSAIRLAEQAVGPIQLVVLDGSVPPGLVPRYLNASDCLVLASVTEGSPNIVKEALACDLPIVATDVGDVAERLKEVSPSRVVKCDAFEFAKALAEVLLNRRRSNGRERVKTCSISRIAEAIRSVYEATVPTKELWHVNPVDGIIQG